MLRSRYRKLALVFSFLWIFFAGPASALPPADPAIQEFIRLVNGERKQRGCRALQWDEPAAAAAREHSRDMAGRNILSHEDSRGRDSVDRLNANHIPYSMAAENIAHGVETGRKVFELWLNSPAHRQNMLDCDFTRQGVGRVGTWWTQLLIRP